VLGIANTATPPTAPPVGGIVLYAENGVLKYRKGTGEIITIT
jgi:hypothetical protein